MKHLDNMCPITSTDEIIKQLNDVTRTAERLVCALSTHDTTFIPDGALATRLYSVACEAAEYEKMLGGE